MGLRTSKTLDALFARKKMTTAITKSSAAISVCML